MSVSLPLSLTLCPFVLYHITIIYLQHGCISLYGLLAICKGLGKTDEQGSAPIPQEKLKVRGSDVEKDIFN